ncbi:MFS transporter [Candidatus Bathyarchaeota archaeon]|nr:MAG: MFS transporter [Candidatus Bathyarchaeota archaeon]
MTPQLKNSETIVFWTLCTMGLFAILSSTMSKNPVLPHFAESLNTPEGFWTGVVAIASTIPGILISLPAGSLSDILGRRKVLLISSVIFASAPFLYLLINSWWQLILVRFYHGFATGMFVPVAEALIAETFPTKRGERISLFSSVTIVGRSIAPILGGSILSVTNNNFHSLYLAVGAAGVTAFITALPFLREKRRIAKKTEALKKTTLKGIVHGWKSVAKARGVLTVGFVEAIQYYTYGSVEFFFVKYMGDIINLDPFLQGAIMTSQLVVVMLSKPYFGRVSDRIGRRAPIILGCIISGAPLVAIPFSIEFPILLFLSVIYGLGFSLVTSSTPALVSELVPIEVVGSAMGLLSTIMDVGQTLGPIICSLILVTSLSYKGLFSSLTFVLILSSIVFILSGIAERQAGVERSV